MNRSSVLCGVPDSFSLNIRTGTFSKGSDAAVFLTARVLAVLNPLFSRPFPDTLLFKSLRSLAAFPFAVNLNKRLT